MTRRFLVIGIFSACLAAVGAAATAARPSLDPSPSREVRTEAEIRELDIGFYQARAARDPYGAGDRAQLARLYLQRARETGDYADLERAASAARSSLAIRHGRNGGAYAVLASSLMAQHRFPDALVAAERWLALEPASAGARGAVAEIQLELGMYGEAERNFGMLATRGNDLAVAPRLARWAELRGRPEEARALLREGRERLERTHGAPREQLAWYQLRLGDLALRHGHLAEAERELEVGLEAAPDDYRLLAARARLALARGDAAQALTLGERVIGRTLEPATLGLMHDAARALGDTTRAVEYARVMAVAVLAQPGPLHRGWSMFLLDQGRDIPTILARARNELEERRDVYGWDVYAWALHRAGRDHEAMDAIGQALALGTRDATLRYHAGMIALALGDTGGARRHLEDALAVNPYWHVTQPREARAVLDSLENRGATR